MLEIQQSKCKKILSKKDNVVFYASDELEKSFLKDVEQSLERLKEERNVRPRERRRRNPGRIGRTGGRQSRDRLRQWQEDYLSEVAEKFQEHQDSEVKIRMQIWARINYQSVGAFVEAVIESIEPLENEGEERYKVRFSTLEPVEGEALAEKIIEEVQKFPDGITIASAETLNVFRINSVELVNTSKSESRYKMPLKELTVKKVKRFMKEVHKRVERGDQDYSDLLPSGVLNMLEIYVKDEYYEFSTAADLDEVMAANIFLHELPHRSYEWTQNAIALLVLELIVQREKPEQIQTLIQKWEEILKDLGNDDYSVAMSIHRMRSTLIDDEKYIELSQAIQKLPEPYRHQVNTLRLITTGNHVDAPLWPDSERDDINLILEPLRQDFEKQVTNKSHRDAVAHFMASVFRHEKENVQDVMYVFFAQYPVLILNWMLDRLEADREAGVSLLDVGFSFLFYFEISKKKKEYEAPTQDILINPHQHKRFLKSIDNPPSAIYRENYFEEVYRKAIFQMLEWIIDQELEISRTEKNRFFDRLQRLFPSDHAYFDSVFDLITISQSSSESRTSERQPRPSRTEARKVSIGLMPGVEQEYLESLGDQGVLRRLAASYELKPEAIEREMRLQPFLLEDLARAYVLGELDAHLNPVQDFDQAIALGIYFSRDLKRPGKRSYLKGFSSDLPSQVRELPMDGGRAPTWFIENLRDRGIQPRTDFRITRENPIVLREEANAAIPVAILDRSAPKQVSSKVMPVVMEDLEGLIERFSDHPDFEFMMQWLGKLTSRAQIHLAELSETQLTPDEIEDELLRRLNLKGYQDFIEIVQNGRNLGLGIRSSLIPNILPALIRRAIEASA